MLHTGPRMTAQNRGSKAASTKESPMSATEAGRSTGVTTTLTLTHPAGRSVVSPRGGHVRARRPITSDWSQLSAVMIATLSAELEGRVAHDLVTDIVRAILDESRHTVQDRSAESMMLEARQRVERLVRARTSR